MLQLSINLSSVFIYVTFFSFPVIFATVFIVFQLSIYRFSVVLSSIYLSSRVLSPIYCICPSMSLSSIYLSFHFLSSFLHSSVFLQSICLTFCSCHLFIIFQFSCPAWPCYLFICHTLFLSFNLYVCP